MKVSPAVIAFLAAGLGAALLACGEPEDPLEPIRQLHAEGRYAQSLEPLRRMIDADPSRPEAHFLLGVALLRTGQPGLAVWPLNKAAESPELAVEAKRLQAQAMLAGRSAPDARVAADEVLEREPDDVNALALRMQANLAMGELEAGLADIDAVLERDPENLAVLVPRVTALISLDRIDEAEAALQVARERIEASDEEIASEMRARLCIAQGLFAFEKGEREAAEAKYAECLERHPEDPLAISQTVSFHDRIGESERATEILRNAYESTGASVFRIALARRVGALGDREEQERLLREDAEAQQSPEAWFTLADFHVEREDFDSAIEAFEQALSANPSPNPMLRFAYADTLVQAGQIEKARQVARRLPQTELRSLIRGRILLAEGKPRAALAAFETGIRLWPNNAAARYLAGQAAERLGDFPRAISEYRESIRAARGLTDAGRALAPLHAVHEEWEGALDAARSYVSTHPRDPEAYRLSARIAHAAGRHQAATRALERLGRLPGQAAVAVATEAELLLEGPGAEKAVEAIERSALDVTDPANLPALRVLLEALADLGRHPRAHAVLDTAIAAHPDVAAFHALKGRVLRASGSGPDAAREAFERAIALDPEEATALAGLAEIAAAAGDHTEAIELYDRAAAASDDPDPAHAAALLLRDGGDADRAAERLERLLDAHPREAAAALDLAKLLAESNEIDRALDYAQRAAWFRLDGAEEAVARIQGLRAARASADATAP